MVHDAPDDPVALHLAELLDQHLLRDARDRPFQLREAQHLAAEQVKEDHQLPAALQELQGLLDMGGGRGRGGIGQLTFRLVPYFSVRS